MKTRNWVYACMLVAVSFLGANIKIFGTVAFDSLPGFVGAILLGPLYGAAIGAVGHLFTSLLSGFPFGLLVHVIIALAMALTMYFYGSVYRLLLKRVNNRVVIYGATAVTGFIWNGPLSLLFVYPVLGRSVVFALAPALLLGAAVNVALAVALVQGLLSLGVMNRENT